MKTGYVNLAEVLEADQPQIPHLEWYARIPEMNPSDYEINLGRIARLGRLAGVETLKIASENGEERKHNYSVVGVDSDGTGVSGSSVTVTKAQAVRTPEEEVERYRFDRAEQWIVLNSNEIKARVQHKENRSIVAGRTFPEQRAWAGAVNRAMQDGIFNVAKQRYLALPEKDSFNMKFRSAYAAGAYSYGYFLQQKGFLGSLELPLLYHGITTVLDAIVAPVYGKGTSDIHLNALPGIMFDRVAASGLAASTRVIRPAKSTRD